MVMEKVTVQIRPSETVTVRLDGNVFISPSNSSRDCFMGVIKQGVINTVPQVKELLSSDTHGAAWDQRQHLNNVIFHIVTEDNPNRLFRVTGTTGGRNI